ncbi:sulfotransferase [Desulfovibrio sp. JC022]|uniref:sulfotransferase family protein n=1 Tax=Desulfovibrio sp. JC022 TaxID=2593642 RepID=UPI0013D8D8ED|nr:sulfotransferase [Desulfovibrio sp. JC022]NDV21837.1 sulfotransferase [Desulfovibrio sp. JC022]
MIHAFIIYDSRSGSTLLSSLLNRHAGVVVAQESLFISLVLENFRDEKSMTVNGVLDLLYSEPRFREWNVDRDILRSRLNRLDQLTYRAVFDTVFGEYLKIRGESGPEVLVIKGARYDFHLDMLRKIYPDSQFIFLLRDGRAVFNSKLDMVSVTGMKMSNNIFQAAFDWKRMLGRLKGQSLIRLRFEDLLADSEGAVTRLLGVLGVSPTGKEITYTQQDYYQLIGKKQKHLHENVGRDPDRKIAVKWKDILSPAQIQLYELICARELLENGYELYAPSNVPFTESAGLILGQAVHWLWLKVRNFFYYAFIDRSLLRKLKERRFEQ